MRGERNGRRVVVGVLASGDGSQPLLEPTMGVRIVVEPLDVAVALLAVEGVGLGRRLLISSRSVKIPISRRPLPASPRMRRATPRPPRLRHPRPLDFAALPVTRFSAAADRIASSRARRSGRRVARSLHRQPSCPSPARTRHRTVRRAPGNSIRGSALRLRSSAARNRLDASRAEEPLHFAHRPDQALAPPRAEQLQHRRREPVRKPVVGRAPRAPSL